VSTHIGAKAGDIAERVLMPGDPLRAQWVAETFLDGAVRYNEVRGMFGYTGSWKGERVSIQGHGMGIPSVSIYAHELFAEYGVRTAIRIGTCGALREDVRVRDVILAMSASTDSATLGRESFLSVSLSTTANISCFLFLSSSISSDRSRTSPSTSTLTYPLWRRFSKTAWCSPLRPRTIGARSITRAPSSISRILSVICSGVWRATVLPHS